MLGQVSQMIRLDEFRHPFGPCPAAIDAAELSTRESDERLDARLREQLSIVYRVPATAILLFERIDRAIGTIVDTTPGTLVGCPPSASATSIEELWPSRERVVLARGVGRHGTLEPDAAADLPSQSVAIVESPADPLGNLLKPVDAVRLARACQVLVVDERFVEFAGQSLLSFGVEFDNVIICRSFDAWAGLGSTPCGWAVASRYLVDRLGPLLEPPRADAMLAALATLENLKSVDATMRLMRDERSRLYRLLRKLSILEPLPSWGPFIAARVAIGSRDEVVAGLRERGLLVHAPAQIGLENYIRIGIGSRIAMDRLRTALLELAPDILDDESGGRGADPDRLALGGEKLIEAKTGQVEQII